MWLERGCGRKVAVPSALFLTHSPRVQQLIHIGSFGAEGGGRIVPGAPGAPLARCPRLSGGHCRKEQVTVAATRRLWLKNWDVLRSGRAESLLWVLYKSGCWEVLGGHEVEGRGMD